MSAVADHQLSRTIEILSRLVSFESLPGRPTHGIIGYIQNTLSELNVQSHLSFDNSGERANLFATIGPAIDGGVVLNGHTDVVPVEGQEWSTDPFTLTRKDNRLYGRGSVDMKGYLACVLASVPVWQTAKLKKPIHIAFTFDEEIGGFGMPVLLESMAQMEFRPQSVIVGEPTESQLITAHKGGFEMRTEITGHAVHSCNPLEGVNAISVATRLISKIEETGAAFAANPHADSKFEPPYATFNIGTIEGGMARNATAGWCNFNWELRQMPGEDGRKIIADIETYAKEQLLPAMQKIHPQANIKFITEAPVPPLNDSNATDAAELISRLTGVNEHGVVSFGSDAGYFSDAGYSTVLYGPGSINRAHKPDEFIKIEELEQGLEFMQKLALYLST